MSDKLMPGNERLLLIPAIEINSVPHFVGPTSFIPFDQPTTALLNYWRLIVSSTQAGGTAGGNIQCATKDDADIGLADSGTDSDRSLCSRGQSEALLEFNFDAALNFFRDLSLTDTGVFNLARDLTFAPDVPYLIVHSVGAGFDVPFTTLDEVDTYYAWTDEPIPGYADGANQTIGATLVPKNLVDVGRKLTV